MRVYCGSCMLPSIHLHRSCRVVTCRVDSFRIHNGLAEARRALSANATNAARADSNGFKDTQLSQPKPKSSFLQPEATHNFLACAQSFSGSTRKKVMAKLTSKLRVLVVYKGGKEAMFYCHGSKNHVTEWANFLETLLLTDYLVCSPVSEIRNDTHDGALDAKAARLARRPLKCRTDEQFYSKLSDMGLGNWWREVMKTTIESLGSDKEANQKSSSLPVPAKASNTRSPLMEPLVPQQMTPQASQQKSLTFPSEKTTSDMSDRGPTIRMYRTDRITPAWQKVLDSRTLPMPPRASSWSSEDIGASSMIQYDMFPRRLEDRAEAPASQPSSSSSRQPSQSASDLLSSSDGSALAESPPLIRTFARFPWPDPSETTVIRRYKSPVKLQSNKPLIRMQPSKRDMEESEVVPPSQHALPG